MPPAGLLLLLLGLLFPPAAVATSLRASWLDSDGRIQAGARLLLKCEVAEPFAGSAVHLLCPLNPATSCAQDCKSVLKELSCRKEARGSLQTYTYTLSSVKPEMAGKWYCQQRGVTSPKLALQVVERPEITSIIASANPVQRGQATTLTCTAKRSSSAQLVFKWRFKGQTLAGSTRTDFSSSLTLPAAREEEDGVYSCEVSDPAGNKASQTVLLNVYYPPSEVTLTSSHASPMPEGTRLVLSCKVTGGRPSPTFQFFRRRSGKALQRVSGDLVVSRTDNGAAFLCRASSYGIPGGSLDSPPIRFDIRFAPSGVRIFEAPAVEVKEGQTQLLRCSSASSGNPTPRLQWQRVARSGETSVLPANQTRQIEDRDNSASNIESVLAIVAHRKGNGDNFQCSLFYQDQLIASQRVSFKVIFGPNGVALNANPSGGVQETYPVYLMCEAQVANPPAKIVWHRQKLGGASKDVTYMSSRSMTNGNYGGSTVASRLTITETTRANDLDSYVCRVEHTESAITLTKTFILRVFYPPDVRVTAVPTNPFEGQSVNLSCITTGGKPLSGFTYTWRHKRDTGELVTLATRTDFLAIRDASFVNAGDYMCEVANAGGRAEGRYPLQIEYSPMMLPTTQTVVSAEVAAPADFVLRLRAFPKPTSGAWYRVLKDPEAGVRREPVQLGGRFRATRDDFVFRLSVTKVRQEDFGEYSCEVMHPVRHRSFPFELKAPVPPVITRDSLGVSITGKRACVTFDPPVRGQFSHLVVRACAGSLSQCHDHHVSEPQFGKACIELKRPAREYSFQLLAFDGSTPVFESDFFRAGANAHGDWPIEIVIGVSIGVGIVVVSLSAAVIVLIVMRCRRDAKSGISMSSTDSHTTSSSRRSPPLNTNVPSSVATSREGLVEGSSDSELTSGGTPEILFVACPAGVANTAYRHVEDSLSLRSAGSRPPDLVLTDHLFVPQSRSSVASSGTSRTSLLSAGRPEAPLDSLFERRNKAIGPDTIPFGQTKNARPATYRPSAYQHSLPPTAEAHLETMENYV